MRQIRRDLWETSVASPFPGLTTHAYLWISPLGTNVLFYAPGGDEDFDELERLGGIDHQYLSHRDEAGPAVAKIGQRFGAVLHSAAAERDDVRQFAEPDVLFDRRHVDDNGVEVIPTPGHSPGSTSFVVEGDGGARYLFTGDTLYVSSAGVWKAGYLPGISDADALLSSLELLRTLEPDLVASSAFAGDAGVHEVAREQWPHAVDQAIAGLRSAV